MTAKMLSVIVPGRNEQFMRHTVEDVLAHSCEDTEVIAVCDGYLPELEAHPRLQVLHFEEAIGQRAATNVGAQTSTAKYIMKMDAHSGTEEGFDVKLIDRMQPDWTMIPSMHRFHVFDWGCDGCGERTYQGRMPEKCEECGGTEFYMHMVWEPRRQFEPTVAWRFDANLHFQYWRKYNRRKEVKEEAKTGIIETMSCIGCCFLMERERFLELGGMDEGHGSWGQYGTELACKAWLSGGKLVTCLDTWVAHMFRTNNFGGKGKSSWPYPINNRQIEAARNYSRELWMNNRWDKQVRPLSWLIEHFDPVPDWDNGALKRQKERERDFVPAE
jgi:glycosyltransferase involved in cell wall biosynthesis